MISRPNRFEALEDGDWMFRMEPTKMERAGITCIQYKVSSRTPKGVWIVPQYVDTQHRERVLETRIFVLQGTGKRFAHFTRQGAMDALKYRKRRQIEILETQLKHAEEIYTMAGGTLPVPPENLL